VKKGWRGVAVANGWAGVQCRGACRNRGVGGGGEAAEVRRLKNVRGSLKRIRQ
jgi:hypothetical protein